MVFWIPIIIVFAIKSGALKSLQNKSTLVDSRGERTDDLSTLPDIFALSVFHRRPGGYFLT